MTKNKETTKTESLAGHIRPKTEKNDLDQNNIGPKTGKPDFVEPKTEKLPKQENLQGISGQKQEKKIWTKNRETTENMETCRTYQTNEPKIIF